MDTRLLDALNTGIVLLNEQRIPCWANEAARRITSMGMRHLASAPLEHWVAAGHAAELKNLYPTALSVGTVLRFENSF
jgi:hypothetical protein